MFLTLPLHQVNKNEMTTKHIVTKLLTTTYKNHLIKNNQKRNTDSTELHFNSFVVN